MITIDSLSVSVADKSVLHKVSFAFEPGRTYYLVGKNGSGKSSLSLALLGHPRYHVTEGIIRSDDDDMGTLSPEERSQRGWFLAFQNVPEIPWVRLGEYLRTLSNTRAKAKDPNTRPLSPLLFRRYISKIMIDMGIPETFLDRDIHVGFSGGERRRIEILQMYLLDPSFVILDEIDSGLDVHALADVGEFLAKFRTPERTFLIITHRFSFSRYLPPDEVIVLDAGRIVRRGDASLLAEVEAQGFFHDSHD